MGFDYFNPQKTSKNIFEKNKDEPITIIGFNKQNALMIVDGALKILRDNNLLSQNDFVEISGLIMKKIKDGDKQ